MYDALLVDFYGTLVAEDGEQIAEITARIARASREPTTPAQVSSRWSALFARGCAESHGARFRSQREIELGSLAALLAELRAPLDPVGLSQPLFAYWARPKPLPGAAEFLRAASAARPSGRCTSATRPARTWPALRRPGSRRPG